MSTEIGQSNQGEMNILSVAQPGLGDTCQANVLIHSQITYD